MSGTYISKFSFQGNFSSLLELKHVIFDLLDTEKGTREDAERFCNIRTDEERREATCES